MIYKVKNGSTLVVKDLKSTPKTKGDVLFKEKGQAGPPPVKPQTKTLPPTKGFRKS